MPSYLYNVLLMVIWKCLIVFHVITNLLWINLYKSVGLCACCRNHWLCFLLPQQSQSNGRHRPENVSW